MTIQKILENFVSKGFIDKDSQNSLSVSDERLISLISKIHSSLSEIDTPWHGQSLNKDIRKKLLFLEELILDHSTSVCDQVLNWLSDNKREFLFCYSPQGSLYGDLLISKSLDELTSIKESISDLSSQPSYTFSESHICSANISYQIPEYNFDEKLNAVLENIENSKKEAFVRLETKALSSELMLGKESFYNSIMSMPKILRKSERFNDICFLSAGYLKSLIDLASPSELLGDFEAMNGESLQDTDQRPDQINRKHYVPIVKRVLTKNNLGDYGLSQTVISKSSDDNSPAEVSYPAFTNEKCKKLVSTLLKEFKMDYESRLLNVLNDARIQMSTTKQLPITKREFFQCFLESNNSVMFINNNQLSELESLVSSYEDFTMMTKDEKLSEKLKNAKELKYTLRLSQKDPLDIRIGNDSGCCIGVYENSDDIGNAYGLPLMLADNGTYIFEVIQQIDARASKRTGIVLAFHTEDGEGNPILACNSTEMSPAMNPKGSVDSVVDFIEKGVVDFAKKHGFKAGLMSKHEYNTSQNYSSLKNKDAKKETLFKIGPFNFYSEILEENKVRVDPESFYTLFDDR